METETTPAPTPATPAPAAPPAPVMDVMPPVPAPADPPADSTATRIPVSPEVASQMTDHSEPVAPAPPAPLTPGPGAAAASSIKPVAAPPVDDDTPPPPGSGDSPQERIDPKPAHDKQIHMPAEAPSHGASVQTLAHRDTTHTAIIATVVITVVLSLLVVMAYMSGNKA